MLEKTLSFAGISNVPPFTEGGINILGICFDSATSYRPGSRFAPNAVREASQQIEWYSPYQNEDLSEKKICDLGNLSQQTLFEPLQLDFNALIDSGVDLTKTKLLTLGGDHSISYLPISHYLKAHKDLVVIHLDAHTDLREEYLSNLHSHACVIKRVVDDFGKDHQLLQEGIRSGTKEEFIWMHQNETLCFGIEDLIERINDLGDRPIYLTLDVDYFDPCVCPGTGTPEAGGASFNDFMAIVKALRGKNVVGADVVELSPMIDSTGNSNCLVSKVVREILLIL